MTGKNGKGNNDGSKPRRNATDPPGTPNTPRQNQPNNVFDWQTNRPDEPRGFPFAPQNQHFFGFGVPQPNPPEPRVLFNVGRGETEEERIARLAAEPLVFGSTPPTRPQSFSFQQSSRSIFDTNPSIYLPRPSSSSVPGSLFSFGITGNRQISSADYGFFPSGTTTTETVPPATTSITDMNGSAKSDSNSNKRRASSDTEVNTEAKRLKTSESNENTSRDRPIVIIVPIIFGANGGGRGEGVSEQASGGASSNTNLNSAFPVINVWTDGNITNVRIDPSLIGGLSLVGAPAENSNQVTESSRKDDEKGLKANQNGAVDADGSREEEEDLKTNQMEEVDADLDGFREVDDSEEQANGGSGSEHEIKTGTGDELEEEEL